MNRVKSIGVWLVLASSVIGGLPGAWAQEPQGGPAGFVAHISKGEWWIDGADHVALKELDVIPDKAQLVSRAPDGEIDIQLFDRTLIHRRGSDSKRERIIADTKPAGWIVWWEAIKSIRQNPQRFVSTIARAPSSRIQDSVVEVKNGDLLLSELLKSVPADTYKVSLTKINSEGQTVSGSRIGPIDLTDNRTAKVGNMARGTYLCSLLNTESDSTGDQSWILVTDSDGYKKMASEWTQTKAAAEHLSDDAPTFCRQVFLHSSLIQAAASQQ